MKKYTMKKRLALLSEWKSLGIPMNQFCQENKIKVSTFHGWNKRYSKKPQPLVELPVKHRETPSSSILVKRGNYHVEIKSDFDPVSLKKLLLVFEQLHD